jgi:hypothetical protein
MKTFFKSLFTQKGEINYLYFSFLLLFLTLLSLLHFREQPMTGFPLFFLFYSVGQAFLEVCVFVLISALLKRWTPPWVFFLFISSSFVLLLLHLTNFIMVRLLDASILYIFKFFFGSGLDHLSAGFQALNMNITMIAIVVGSFLAIPVAGLGFYWLTLKLTRRKPLNLSVNQIVLTIGVIGISLFLLDVMAHPFLTRRIYSKYQKTLPLGATFLAPTPNHMVLANPFPAFRDEKETVQKIPSETITHRPNIYFFVIETFRKDFLNAAPNLTNFGNQHIQFKRSFANAPASNLSWFALFHADFPIYWNSMRDAWTGGSIPLQMLKKMGYKIHVYSSADLRFFNMDKLLFGNHRQLADVIEEYYTLDGNMEACDRDALAFQSLKRDLKPEGHAYLIFLDSPHSEYSFPKDFPLEYEPICKEIGYLSIGSKSPELEHIKNRYRNSIHYVDSLMGQFFEMLKKENLYEDGIISITADHGEEFFEDGAMFHGTHLNQYQTSVPILLKFSTSDWISKTEEATHMDLFPSILHYLTNKSDFTHLFDGRSIFSSNRLPYRIAFLQNGPETPVEFFLEKNELKLRARFVDSSKLEIVELQGFLESDIFAPLSTGAKNDPSNSSNHHNY